MENNVHRNPIVPDTSEFASRVGRHLQVIYKSEFNESLVNRILTITAQRFPSRRPWDEKDIVLITYGNSITSPPEKPLRTLHGFLREQLTGSITCLHILPFFPFTSDDGFAITDFTQVNPVLGDWNDLDSLAGEFDLMSDLVINHVSTSHFWFRNFLEGRTPGKDYFIEEESGANYSLVARPRSTPLFTLFETGSGTKYVWTTFSADQADLNFSNPEVLLEMIRILVFLISHGVRIIRLDAIAFLWKKSGTTCLHLKETHEIVKLFRDIVEYVSQGTVLLTETNVPNAENWSYFGNGDEAHMVYQFSLPPLLLYTLFSENAVYLTQWATTIPETAPDQTFLNYTASHDGIGLRPLEGLLPLSDLSALIEGMTGFGGMVSYKTNRDGSQSPYELNITYFDALKGTRTGTDSFQTERFLCSQAIMLSLKGVPAVYIHSLLATTNDYELVKQTGRARSINRSVLNLEVTRSELMKDGIRKRVFSELKRFMQIRRQHTAFHPGSQMNILQIEDGVFAFIRFNESTGEKICCISNVTGKPITLAKVFAENTKGYDLFSGKKITVSDPILLNPCQTMWIVEQEDAQIT